MRCKLYQLARLRRWGARPPRRRTRALRPPLGRTPQPARARPARARPRHSPTEPGRSGSPSACAPTACRPSQTPSPEAWGEFQSETIRQRPRSMPRRRSATSSCRAAALPARGPQPPQRRWRSCSRSPIAYASTASPISPTHWHRCRPASAPGGSGGLTDYEGAILVFPRGINMQSPAFKQAASVCGGAFLSHHQ